jgi:hypothetical protein
MDRRPGHAPGCPVARDAGHLASPTPRPRHALRLGFSAQDAFFGKKRHDGWAWLTDRAQAWPAAYRSYYWEGFETAGDSFKGTIDINEGSK